MKYLKLVILALIFASCSTTHKIKTESHKSVDSVVTAVKDSATVNKAQNYTDNYVAKGIDVTFDYGDSTDPVQSTSDTTNPTNAELPSSIVKNIVNKSGLAGRIPTRVTIHIDSVSNQSSITTTQDSTHVKSDTHAKVNTTETVKTKTVQRSGLSGWMVPIIGFLLIIGLVWFAVKKNIIKI
jgi:hypothetical protein